MKVLKSAIPTDLEFWRCQYPQSKFIQIPGDWGWFFFLTFVRFIGVLNTGTVAPQAYFLTPIPVFRVVPISVTYLFEQTQILYTLRYRVVSPLLRPHEVWAFTAEVFSFLLILWCMGTVAKICESWLDKWLAGDDIQTHDVACRRSLHKKIRKIVCACVIQTV